MKKLVTLLLVISLMLSSVYCFAAEENSQKVEINFKVNSNVITINGKEHTVETAPYVVEPGVTLVPVRIITEAFGATVDWTDETQTAKVLYPGVEILLQVGNTLAEVNGKAQTLLASPELVNDRTMIPIRFISENFGAEVGYDDVTETVSIIKDYQKEDTTVVDGAVDALKVGDSYYNWSMENTSNMYMTEREFDGWYTCFDFDDNNYIEIEIYETKEDYDIDRQFSYIKNSLDGYALVKTDKDTSDPKKKTINFQFKDAKSYNQYTEIVTQKYTYCLYGTFETKNAQVRDEGLRILGTFEVGFDSADTYDLSNVKDGKREYVSEELNFKIKVPEDYYISSDESSLNEIDFSSSDEDDYISRITINVYSIKETGTAKELADRDFKVNNMYTNEELIEFSEGVTEMTFGENTGYGYTLKSLSNSLEMAGLDFFFEKGDYVYNAVVYTKKFEELESKTAVLDDLVVSEIDYDKVGVLMRNDPDLEGTYFIKEDDWQVEAPKVFAEVYSDEECVTFMNVVSGHMVSIEITDAQEATINKIYNVFKETEADIKKEKGNKIIQTTRKVKINNISFVEMIYCVDEENTISRYYRSLVGIKNGKLISVFVSSTELSRSKLAVEQEEAIINSITIK